MFTVGFYMMFAFVQGTLSSMEQKPGLRVSMGLGIIFCITEVQILQDVQAQILEGKQADRRILSLLNIFPISYCAFEIIILLRIIFFGCFNVLNAYSLCFVVDAQKLKLLKSWQFSENQTNITMTMQEIHNLQSKCSDVKLKVSLKDEIDSVKAYGQLMKKYMYETGVQIEIARRANIPGSSFQFGGLRKWIQRFALAGLAIGYVLNEFWPKIKKYFQ